MTPSREVIKNMKHFYNTTNTETVTSQYQRDQ